MLNESVLRHGDEGTSNESDEEADTPPKRITPLAAPKMAYNRMAIARKIGLAKRPNTPLFKGARSSV
jgi:hypothetical protein